MDANGQDSLGAECPEEYDQCQLECCSTRPARKSGIICCPIPTRPLPTHFRPPTLVPELSCDFLWDRPTPGQSSSTCGMLQHDPPRLQRANEDPRSTFLSAPQSQFTPRDYANELHWRQIIPPHGNGGAFVLPQRMTSVRPTPIPRRFSAKPQAEWSEWCQHCQQASICKANCLKESETRTGCPCSPPPSLGRISPSSMTRPELSGQPTTPEQYESTSFGTQWSQTNNSGTIREYKLWHPMESNLAYREEQQGETMTESAVSVTGRVGMGNYYVIDMFRKHGNNDDQSTLTFTPEATFFWHEK
nr:MAG: capsid protein [Genomoviridae sp.]